MTNKNNDLFITPWNSRLNASTTTPPSSKKLTPEERKRGIIKRRIEVILEKQALDKEWS